MRKDISWVTAALIFFLYDNFLANLNYILNIFLDKNVFFRDQQHFAAERTVTQSEVYYFLIFLSLTTPSSLQNYQKMKIPKIRHGVKLSSLP